MAATNRRPLDPSAGSQGRKLTKINAPAALQGDESESTETPIKRNETTIGILETRSQFTEADERALDSLTDTLAGLRLKLSEATSGPLSGSETAHLVTSVDGIIVEARSPMIAALCNADASWHHSTRARYLIDSDYYEQARSFDARYGGRIALAIVESPQDETLISLSTASDEIALTPAQARQVANHLLALATVLEGRAR